MHRGAGGRETADRFAGKWNRLLNLRLLIVPGFRYFSRCIYFHLKNYRARDTRAVQFPRAFYISDIPFDDVFHRRISSRSYYGRSFVNYKIGLLGLSLFFFFFFFLLISYGNFLWKLAQNEVYYSVARISYSFVDSTKGNNRGCCFFDD